MRTLLFAAAALVAALALPAQAADPVKIGMITTLSGGGASLGIDTRDGFMLAVKMRGGRLGGAETTIDIVDDARKVGTAKQVATRMLQQDDVDVVTGIVWSNLALAVVPAVTKAGKFYLSTNAAPSQLAGAGCHPHYFSVSYQNDNLDEAAGYYVNAKGFGNVYLIAPNYPAGKDHLAGFKRYYQGELAGEVYTKLGQVDYAAEIANLRAADPEAVYIFLPGGMGINFTKQYAQAGLIDRIPLFGPAFSFSQDILGAIGDSALGVYNTAQWSPDLDNPANREFVAAFQEEYGRLPSLYASQGYDTALLLDAAIAKVGGDLSDPAAFRAALRAAEFASVRGRFSFGKNQHPVQDIYMREVVRQGDVTTNQVVERVFSIHQDAYAAQCRM